MGQDPTHDPAPPRRLSGRLLLLAGAVGAGLALLLGVLFRDALPGLWRSGGGDVVPPGALADYVPEDSEAVLAVDLHALLDAPAGRRHLAPLLKELVRQSERRFRWIGLTGVRPFDDLDSLLVSFAPGAGGQPLWLARGRIDPSRFQLAADRLRPTAVDHFHAWEYVDRPAKRTTLLATAGDALVVSDTPARVVAALDRAHHSRPADVHDVTLRDRLAEVDRRQGLWLAASFKNLGPVARLDSVWLEMMLRPLMTHAESVRGGLSVSDGVRAELHFHTATEEAAAKLEADLKNVCGVAGGAPLLLGRQRELLPLFRLLAGGQVERDGKTVSLSCQLSAAQLDE